MAALSASCPAWRVATAPSRNAPPANGRSHRTDRSSCRPMGARSADSVRRTTARSRVRPTGTDSTASPVLHAERLGERQSQRAVSGDRPGGVQRERAGHEGLDADDDAALRAGAHEPEFRSAAQTPAGKFVIEVHTDETRSGPPGRRMPPPRWRQAGCGSRRASPRAGPAARLRDSRRSGRPIPAAGYRRPRS